MTRIEEIEARIKAASGGPQEFSVQDIPYLLAQLREARGKLEAVEELRQMLAEPREADAAGIRSPGVKAFSVFVSIALDRILNPQEAE